MIKLKTLTVKNFMSVGNVTQALNLEGHELTLVLGQNIDLGGDDAGSRNGTGKTTILNALSFALFADALSARAAVCCWLCVSVPCMGTKRVLVTTLDLSFSGSCPGKCFGKCSESGPETWKRS